MSSGIHDIVSHNPLVYFVLESDAPYINSSRKSSVHSVVNIVAEKITGETFSDIIAMTTANAKIIYGGVVINPSDFKKTLAMYEQITPVTKDEDENFINPELS